MGARVVEGTGLENRQGVTPFVGSNPTPSAKKHTILLILFDKLDLFPAYPTFSPTL